MPVKLWGNITDKTTNYSIELRALRWVVPSNSYKSVMFSECELLAWHIQQVNQSIDTQNLPLNCEFIFYLGCGTYPKEAATDEYNQLEAATYIANENLKLKFPIGQTYFVHPIEYVSHAGLHTKAFRVTKDDKPPVIESKEDLSDES